MHICLVLLSLKFRLRFILSKLSVYFVQQLQTAVHLGLHANKQLTDQLQVDQILSRCQNIAQCQFLKMQMRFIVNDNHFEYIFSVQQLQIAVHLGLHANKQWTDLLQVDQILARCHDAMNTSVIVG